MSRWSASQPRLEYQPFHDPIPYMPRAMRHTAPRRPASHMPRATCHVPRAAALAALFCHVSHFPPFTPLSPPHPTPRATCHVPGDVTTTMLWIHGQISTTATMQGLLLPSLVSVAVPVTAWALTAPEVSASKVLGCRLGTMFHE